MKNWAITIGVNDYRFMRPLNYAERDADMIRDLFEGELAFGSGYHFTSSSSPIAQDYGPTLASTPTYSTLSRFLDVRFERRFLTEGDNLWFFFAGHGICEDGVDYLIPSDGYRQNRQGPVIPLRQVSDRLRRSGAGNVILLIDACRSDSSGTRDGFGVGMEEQQGVITLFACSPGQYSCEIKALQQGAFTYILLESLRLGGEHNCATVQRLYDRLRSQVPALTQHHKLGLQTPYGKLEPISKSQLILLPQLATGQDVVTVKNLALKAELTGDWVQAKQLWISVLSASHMDIEAIDGIGRAAAAIQFSKTTEVENEEVSSENPPPEAEVTQPLETTALNAIERLPRKALVSDRRVDYVRLGELLHKQQWRVANEETELLMLQASRRRQEGWLSYKAIERFSQTDLQTIDRLWRHYSGDRFGFTVQLQIFLAVHGEEQSFTEKVAWEQSALFGGLTFSNEARESLQFDIAAPIGHLPFVFGGEHEWIFTRFKAGSQ